MSAEFKREVSKQLKEMYEKDIDKIIIIGISKTGLLLTNIGFDKLNDIVGALEVVKHRTITNNALMDKP